MPNSRDELQFCDRQPLHTLNTIQPHGAVLVVAVKDYRILQFSANLPAFLGMAEGDILGAGLASLVDQSTLDELKKLRVTGELGLPQLHTISFVKPKARSFIGFIHCVGESIVLEFEFINEQTGSTPLQPVLRNLQRLTTSMASARSVEELAGIASREIKAMSGFDKVMIYVFDDNWNGLVVGEEGEPGMEQYLGLKFPATDVPKQARDLYYRTPYRVIPDRQYVPVPLVPALNPLTNAAIDLSDVKLRGVSEVHLEYLKNMDVAASMSTRIVHKETLWGLIACHHREPKTLGFEECTLFELISSVISARISSLANHAASEARMKLFNLFSILVTRIPLFDNPIKALANHKSELLGLLGADGVAIAWNSDLLSFGVTPDAQEINRLKDWLKRKNFSNVTALPCLSAAFEEAKAYSNIASGLLVLPIQPYEGNYLLAFRPEVVKTISWGGNPNEVVTVEPDSQRYHPRESFAIWKETVRDTAQHWSEVELDLAERFRNVIVEHTLKDLTNRLEMKVNERTTQLASSNRKLEQTHDDLMQFTYITSHDLQEPLRKILLFGNELEKHISAGGPKMYIKKILGAAERASTLITDLVNFSNLSGSQKKELTDLNEILESVLKDFNLMLTEKEFVVEAAHLPGAEIIPDQFRQVFANLISNAIKFSKPGRKPRLIITGERTSVLDANSPADPEGPYWRVAFSDNGIGFNPVYADKVFQMFERLHTAEYPGTGIGLAIVKKIIEGHGGMIKVFAKEDEGATFTLVFPLWQIAGDGSRKI